MGATKIRPHDRMFTQFALSCTLLILLLSKISLCNTKCIYLKQKNPIQKHKLLRTMDTWIRCIEFTLTFYYLKIIYTIGELCFTICRWKGTILCHSRECTSPKSLNEKQKQAAARILAIFVRRGLKLISVSFQKILNPLCLFWGWNSNLRIQRKPKHWTGNIY